MSPAPHDHHHHHGHDVGQVHRSGHTSLRLARTPLIGSVHRVGRRQFLTELGRNTFAIAVLGGVVAACSSDDAADVEPTDSTSGEASNEATADTGAFVADEATDQNRLRWAQAALGSVSAYVLVRGNEAAVVDTGSSGSVDEIGTALSTLGATYDDVRHVILTHSHPDHVGSLAGVLDAASSATPYAGALDIPNISGPTDVTAVGDGDDVFGLRVIDTPGHTPGSISVLDPGIGLLIAGDALTGNSDGTALSGPNERFTSDMDTGHRSILKLAGYEVEAVGMGHGQPVTDDAGTLLLGLVDQLTATGDLPTESSSDSTSDETTSG